MRARKKMIEGNAGLAYSLALRYSSYNTNENRSRHIDPDDILQAAMVGLIEAVDRYDPERGFRFSSYACFRILKRIRQDVAQQHWTTVKPPRDMTEKYLGSSTARKNIDVNRYVDTYVRGLEIPQHATEPGDDIADVDALKSLSGYATLTVEEKFVFDVEFLGQDGDLSGLDLEAIEKSIADKMRECLLDD